MVLIIVTRNGKIVWKNLIEISIIMLKFTEQPKTPGITFKKNMGFPERNKLFVCDLRANMDETSADMVQFTKSWNWKWIV